MAYLLSHEFSSGVSRSPSVDSSRDACPGFEYSLIRAKCGFLAIPLKHPRQRSGHAWARVVAAGATADVNGTWGSHSGSPRYHYNVPGTRSWYVGPWGRLVWSLVLKPCLHPEAPITAWAGLYFDTGVTRFEHDILLRMAALTASTLFFFFFFLTDAYAEPFACIHQHLEGCILVGKRGYPLSQDEEEWWHWLWCVCVLCGPTRIITLAGAEWVSGRSQQGASSGAHFFQEKQQKRA